METEIATTTPKRQKSHRKKKKSRKLAGELSEQQLLKQVEEKNPEAYSELCQLVLKEGLTKVIKAVKTKAKTQQLLEENDPLLPPVSSNKNVLQGNLRPLKLPKLKQTEDKSKILSQYEATPKSFTSQRSLNSLVQSRSSPHLLPLKTLTNAVFRAGFKSRVGYLKGKPKLNNQDAVVIKPSLQNLRGQYLFAIVDGHGQEGFAVTEFIKENLITYVEMLLPVDPKPEKIQKSLILATENLSTALLNSKIETVFSGCTLLTIVISGNNLICSNLGNCKAIIGNEGHRWQMIPLTTEHTLDNKKECERMLEKNARIEYEAEGSFYNKVYLHRAYMGTQNVPGLEITRSIGDKCGKLIGVISTPEAITYYLSPEDKFLIVGSSGFWRFVSEMEAYLIVRHSWEKNQIEESCEDLMRHASMKWKENCRDKDDISIIVAYFGGSNKANNEI